MLVNLARYSLKNGSEKEVGTVGQIQSCRQKQDCQKTHISDPSRSEIRETWCGIVVAGGVLLGKTSKSFNFYVESQTEGVQK